MISTSHQDLSQRETKLFYGGHRPRRKRESEGEGGGKRERDRERRTGRGSVKNTYVREREIYFSDEGERERS